MCVMSGTATAPIRRKTFLGKKWIFQEEGIKVVKGKISAQLDSFMKTLQILFQAQTAARGIGVFPTLRTSKVFMKPHSVSLATEER